MTGTSTAEVYYDPFDFDIDDDPYPIWRRLRDEAPLYYNDKYDFYALSRYEDVSRGLMNFDTYRSGRGTTMDIIMSGIDVPPGVILFEDPPIHDVHRHVLSKVFTPRRMEAIEPLTRAFCARALTRWWARDGSTSSRTSARWSRCVPSATCWASPKTIRKRSATGAAVNSR